MRPGGGRTWWAHFEFTRINIELTILQNQIEDQREFWNASAVGIVKSLPVCFDAVMSQPSTGPTLYKGYRFPPAIISYCVWLYYRFGVSLRDVSELMLARGIEVWHEAIRLGRCGSARSTPEG